MTSKQRLKEDRALRDAARALVDADVAHLKQDLSGKSIGERMIGGVGEGAKAVFQTAGETASNNRGVLAAIAGALVLWFAKNPIADLIFGEEPEEDIADEDAETSSER